MIQPRRSVLKSCAFTGKELALRKISQMNCWQEKAFPYFAVLTNSLCPCGRPCASELDISLSPTRWLLFRHLRNATPQPSGLFASTKKVYSLPHTSNACLNMLKFHRLGSCSKKPQSSSKITPRQWHCYV